MTLVCDRCRKGTIRGNKIGRARQGLNYRTKRTFQPNLHAFKGVFKGKQGKWRFCTKCLRIVKKEQKAKEKAAPEKASKQS